MLDRRNREQIRENRPKVIVVQFTSRSDPSVRSARPAVCLGTGLAAEVEGGVLDHPLRGPAAGAAGEGRQSRSVRQENRQARLFVHPGGAAVRVASAAIAGAVPSRRPVSAPSLTAPCPGREESVWFRFHRHPRARMHSAVRQMMSLRQGSTKKTPGLTRAGGNRREGRRANGDDVSRSARAWTSAEWSRQAWWALVPARLRRRRATTA
jgi:hypothetical protein